MKLNEELYEIGTNHKLDYNDFAFISRKEGLYFDKNNNKIILSIDGDIERFNLVDKEIKSLLEANKIIFIPKRSLNKMTNTMEYLLNEEIK